MDAQVFKAARKALGLSQDAAATMFGVDRKTIGRWEAGASPVPEHVAFDVPFVPEPMSHVPSDWRTMSHSEREALPLGHPGWRYTRGSWLPKGQWIEHWPERVYYPSGAYASGIRWGSNGVGEPTMNLFGSTKDAKIMPHNRETGWYPLAPGAYIPMKPNASKIGNAMPVRARDK